jgi:hypothetical protein
LPFLLTFFKEHDDGKEGSMGERKLQTSEESAELRSITVSYEIV